VRVVSSIVVDDPRRGAPVTPDQADQIRWLQEDLEAVRQQILTLRAELSRARSDLIQVALVAGGVRPLP